MECVNSCAAKILRNVSLFTKEEKKGSSMALTMTETDGHAQIPNSRTSIVLLCGSVFYLFASFVCLLRQHFHDGLPV